MDRDDILDARDRLIGMGLAAEADDRIPAHLDDQEYSGIESAYAAQYGRFSEDRLWIQLVGRYGGYPLVNVVEIGTVVVEGDRVEIGGLEFHFVHCPSVIALFDGKRILDLPEAHTAGLMGTQTLSEVRDSLSRMHLVWITDD